MTASQILGSTYEEGLKAPHYTNRRLLTAEDLHADQQAALARLALLGQAVGYGVVHGLEVELLGGATLRVSAGLGFTKGGQPVRLPQATQLTFTTPSSAGAAAIDGGRFQDCAVALGGGAAGTPVQGAYLLVAAPISRLEGSAPLKAAAGSAATPACAAQWEVEGLQFRAIRLDGFDAQQGVNDTNRRNRLAHWCLGSLTFQQIESAYLAEPQEYGLLAQLGGQDVSGCDLPLAVFYWTGSSIRDLDLWSVRRRLVQSGALSMYAPLLGDRRTAEGQARLAQFQSHLQAVVAGSVGNTVSAVSVFPILPPAGLVQLQIPYGTLYQVAYRLSQRLIWQLSGVVNAMFPFFSTQIPWNEQMISQCAQLASEHASQSGLSHYSFFGRENVFYTLVDPDTIDDKLRASWYHNAFSASAPIDLFVAYTDVAQLLAPEILYGIGIVTADLSRFGISAALIQSLAAPILLQELAELRRVPVESVNLTPIQPITLFVKRDLISQISGEQ